MPRSATTPAVPSEPRPVRGRRGFTLAEVTVATVVAGLVLAIITAHLIETTRVSLNITRTLEHSRNAREFLDQLSADLRAAQIVQLYPSFTDRSSEARDGGFGNYLVLHRINPSGTIIRTVGYYVTARADGKGWILARHDSASGHSNPGALPAAGTAGQHSLVNQIVRLPTSAPLFRNALDRGISVQGEFGTVDTAGNGRVEFVRCTLATRS